ncbi:MAG: hypothetical protein SCM57_08320 [Bacillota bacterium]|nr:hypothetical protein [Bacillota bacterium]
MERYFYRFEPEEGKKVDSIEIRATISDAVGSFSFTDIMLQEGRHLTGYSQDTREMLQKLREDSSPAQPKHYNAVVRGTKTLIIPNRGAYWAVEPDAVIVPTALDFQIKHKENLPRGIALGQDRLTRLFYLPGMLQGNDTLEVVGTEAKVLKNGVPAQFRGQFLYAAWGNPRFPVTLQGLEEEQEALRPEPSARVFIELQEWQLAEGGKRI